jgi:integrase
MPHVQKRTHTSRDGKTTTAWQARYTAPDGRERTRRFERKVDAERWLVINGADLVRGAWVDPEDGKVTLRAYANEWLGLRDDLRSTTRAKYRYLLDGHILPKLGDTTLGSLSSSRVRAWHAALRQRHPSTAASAYRLLAGICNTAVVDKKIASSPCTVKGASTESAKERPVATVAEVAAAAGAAPERYRLAILLAMWCQLRRGEVLGLQRQDVDELHATIRVCRTWTVQTDGKLVEDKPKTEAGTRTVAIPPNVMPALTAHLESVLPGQDAWLFPGGGDRPALPRTLDRVWDAARLAAGRPDLRFHDLRHSGLTLAAATGATTAELMRRAGHKSPAAAIRYQHATEDRDRVLAAALAELATPAEVVSLRRTTDGQRETGRTASPK